MAKKNTRSTDLSSPKIPPTPDRRRTARATTDAGAASPELPVAEPARDTADDLAAEGNGNAGTTPTYEEIAEAAYQRYLARGGQHGYDFDDWIDAERSLRARSA